VICRQGGRRPQAVWECGGVGVPRAGSRGQGAGREVLAQRRSGAEGEGERL